MLEIKYWLKINICSSLSLEIINYSMYTSMNIELNKYIGK